MLMLEIMIRLKEKNETIVSKISKGLNDLEGILTSEIKQNIEKSRFGLKWISLEYLRQY